MRNLGKRNKWVARVVSEHSLAVSPFDAPYAHSRKPRSASQSSVGSWDGVPGGGEVNPGVDSAARATGSAAPQVSLVDILAEQELHRLTAGAYRHRV